MRSKNRTCSIKKRTFTSPQDEENAHGFIWNYVANIKFLLISFSIVLISSFFLMPISSVEPSSSTAIGHFSSIVYFLISLIILFVFTMLPAVATIFDHPKIVYPCWVSVISSATGWIITSLILMLFFADNYYALMNPIYVLYTLVFTVFPYKVLRSEFGLKSLL